MLIIQVDENVDVNVGALGKLTFEKGMYAYVGSAQANLEQRIKRHLGKEKRLFWHIDYLLSESSLEVIWQIDSLERLECVWARAVTRFSDARILVRGFGSSDCNCPSHLIYLPYRPGDHQIRRSLTCGMTQPESKAGKCHPCSLVKTTVS